jgi:hypothetical protein
MAAVHKFTWFTILTEELLEVAEKNKGALNTVEIYQYTSV